MRSLRRIEPALAALLAACVVLLGLAAVSPELHALIHERHGHDTTPAVHACHADSDIRHAATPDTSPAADLALDDEHACAVTLFAHGCDLDVPVFHLSPTSLTATSVAQFTELLLSRTLRGPERVCGPPALA